MLLRFFCSNKTRGLKSFKAFELRDSATSASELRELLDEFDEEHLRAKILETLLADAQKTHSSSLDELHKTIRSLEHELANSLSQTRAEKSFLEQENHRLTTMLRSERARDLANADEVRYEAGRALQNLESEIAAHNATRHLASLREEALEKAVAEATETLAAAERRANFKDLGQVENKWARDHN
mmetsp:Transcript_21557/g.57569  ORF Transcript_21557/g.57569 Transcript_21557/m.57569 type:complete len:185 (+) Transcript_21557:426-980(+)